MRAILDDIVPIPGTVCSRDRVWASWCLAVVTMGSSPSRRSASSEVMVVDQAADPILAQAFTPITTPTPARTAAPTSTASKATSGSDASYLGVVLTVLRW